ncbi:hypothetical protein AYO38_00245 [bacterium SCGC AG-212-C10]|nr:hypothetical protein AYO38_00245 [bacterium SCGC AG-212-C10]
MPIARFVHYRQSPLVTTSTRSLIFAAKSVRTFSDGMMAIAIAQYADALGFSGLQAGAIASAALVGTSVTTFLVGRYVERIGRRRLLTWGALLTVASGFAYAGFSGFWPLLTVAFLGTANPTSGDVSAFLPVEQAILAQETTTRDRVSTFARFNIFGSLAGAAGALASGSTVLLEHIDGIGREDAVRVLFVLYGLLGFVTLLLVRRLQASAELAPDAPRGGLDVSKKRVYTLSALFATDSFAGGMIVSSLIALYLFRRFDLDPGTTGAVFFAASLLQTLSFIASARLANRFGMVRTMVFTHLPSNALLLGVAFSPAAPLAIAFLLARAILSQMDVPPRQALVMSVVEPHERAAAASITGLSRSVSSSFGPSAGGALLGIAGGGPFAVCAVLKSTYDVGLFVLFRDVENREV